MFQDSTAKSPIKIIDFGLAEIFERSNETSEIAAGTVLYMAPEVFGKSKIVSHRPTLILCRSVYKKRHLVGGLYSVSPDDWSSTFPWKICQRSTKQNSEK